MKKIGFVGLGMMGEPMARCLLRAGFGVTGFDLHREAVERLAAAGATPARGLEEVASCDAVIVMVNTDAQAREVIGALLEVLRDRPRPVLCMSTILPSSIRTLGENAARAGVGVLDAPVSGGAVVAGLGRLAIMAGGERALFDTLLPVLSAMGGTVRHVGPLGAGLTLKLVNNMIAINVLPLVLEALRIGLAQGLDLATMLEVVRASSGNTWLTDQWDQARLLLEILLRDPAQLESLLQTGLKDLELAATWCEQSGVEAPLLEGARNLLARQSVESMRANLARILETRSG